MHLPCLIIKSCFRASEVKYGEVFCYYVSHKLIGVFVTDLLYAVKYFCAMFRHKLMLSGVSIHVDHVPFLHPWALKYGVKLRIFAVILENITRNHAVMKFQVSYQKYSSFSEPTRISYIGHYE